MLHELLGSGEHARQTAAHLPVMEGNTLFRLSTNSGHDDHEIVHSAANSPVVGVIAPSEDLGSSTCGEIGPYGIISYEASEDPTQHEHSQEAWSGFEVPSSPGSSCSVFTPAEDLTSPSPYVRIPSPAGFYSQSIAHPAISELHSLALEGGMQSPASYYPNSPSDSFPEPDVPELLPSPSLSGPSVHGSDSAAMDPRSVPETLLTGSSRSGHVERPYAQLLKECFLSAPDHSMSLKDIYRWFEQNTTKVDPKSKGWQNSIRHNLSMNAAFKKQEVTEGQLSADTNRSASRSRSNIWTMEDWAVEGTIQSTTRYRKQTSARRSITGRNSQRHTSTPYPGRNYTTPNYMLGGSEHDYSHGMDRAAAGRRGGVATRHARERHRAELQQQQQHLAMHHPAQVIDMGNSGWHVPRSCPSDALHSFQMSDHFRLGGDGASMHGYLGIHNGLNMTPSTGYATHLAGAAHLSPATVQQHHASIGSVAAGDMGVTGPASQQQRQQVPGQSHHHHSTAYHYGSPVGTFDYTNGSGVHSVHQQ